MFWNNTKKELQQSDCDCPGHRELFKSFGIEREYSDEITEATMKEFTDFLNFLSGGTRR